MADLVMAKSAPPECEGEHLARLEVFNDEQYALWLSLFESRVGMILPHAQRNLFEFRIRERMQACNLEMMAYYQFVKANLSEWQRLVERIMVHETSFFRHMPSFELLEERLPLFEGPVHLWSVGCATGEETWSLAMTASSRVRDGFSVMASDISDSALNIARQGRYPARHALRIPESYRERYCTWEQVTSRGQTPSGSWQVSAVLREHVLFHRFNLMACHEVPFRRLQVIFCQNVLIYFRMFDRRDILNALVERLDKGGMLILGPGEMADWEHPAMKRIKYAGTLAYERICA